MARAIAELERDIRALSTEDKHALLGVLIAELDTPDNEVVDLMRTFISAVERSDQTLRATLEKLRGLDEEMERAAAEVRKRVRASGEPWPFALA